MKKILITILLGIVCSASAYAAGVVEAHPSLDQIVVNLSDGVDEFEAEKIGYEHFRIMGCGAAVVRDAGDVWLVEGLAGFAAKSLGFIHIAKKDGKVSKVIRSQGALKKWFTGLFGREN